MLDEYGLAIAMVLGLLFGIFSGYPVAFLLGGLGSSSPLLVTFRWRFWAPCPLASLAG